MLPGEWHGRAFSGRGWGARYRMRETFLQLKVGPRFRKKKDPQGKATMKNSSDTSTLVLSREGYASAKKGQISHVEEREGSSSPASKEGKPRLAKNIRRRRRIQCHIP